MTGDVTWVEADGPPPEPPEGPAPKLTDSSRPPVSRSSRVVGVLAGAAVLVSLAALAATGGIILGRERASLVRALDAAQRLLDPGALEALRETRRVRVEAETLAARRVKAAVLARMTALLTTCEGGDWCADRQFELATQVRVADDLLRDAPETVPDDGRPIPWFLVDDLEAIEALITEAKSSSPGPAETERVLALEAERAALAIHVANATEFHR